MVNMPFLTKIQSSVRSKNPLDVAVERYIINYDSGNLSGYRKMTPSWERELRNVFKNIQNKPIFRAVRAKKVNKSNLGVFWTFDPNSVSAYWGDPNLPLWILVVKVSEKDIDWDATVEQYMKPQYAESEVRLKKNSHPKIIHMFSDIDSFYMQYATKD